ncbi:Internal alternative NAD(P)H-ubiquinone oxidoreductase A1, mitochondrial, partial [Linum perenne]
GSLWTIGLVYWGWPFISGEIYGPSKISRIGIDEWLRVPNMPDVFAIGDCSGFVESTGKQVLPALAQVAERQGKYLAAQLNRIGKAGGGRANGGADMDVGDPFVYKHMGSMATIGRHKALVDLRQTKVMTLLSSLCFLISFQSSLLIFRHSFLPFCLQKGKGISMAGFVSWFIWRSAYLTRVVSWRNRFYVAVNWLTTMVFGRDISRL